MSSSTRQLVLITGSNRGIGKELARALAKTGDYTVILTARSLDNAKKAAQDISGDGQEGSIVPKRLDVEDEETIKACAAEVEAEFGKLDVLINNAGVCLDFAARKGEYSTQEAWTKTYSINVIGSQNVTTAFAPLLLKSDSPRLLFVSSSVGSLGLDVSADMVYNRPLPAAGKFPKDDAGGMSTYRSSKAAMNMMAREWYRVLKEEGVKVYIICPGRVATNFGGWEEDQAKQQGGTEIDLPVQFMKAIVKGEKDGSEGKFIHQGGEYPF